MSNKIFTKEEIAILSSNKYVKHVSAKGITYTDEFKHIFITENEKGKLPRAIFEECGFGISVLGRKRMQSAADRWRDAYRRDGVLGLEDTRKGNSGRPREKELSIEEKYERLKAQNELLKAENELLKKTRYARKEDDKEEIRLPSEVKFLLINSVVKKHGLKNLISYLCKIAGVSRSGYYNYFSSKSQAARTKSDSEDEVLKENVLKAFIFKRRQTNKDDFRRSVWNHIQLEAYPKNNEKIWDCLPYQKS